MSQIQPATDEQIAGAETYVKHHVHGLTTGNEYILALIARIRQEQAEVATLQRLLDEERLRASEYECAGRGLQEEHDALMGELGEIRQERMDVIRERDALRAEVERLRAELEWAAESFDELGAHGSARLTRLRIQPLAPAEVPHAP